MRKADYQINTCKCSPTELLKRLTGLLLAVLLSLTQVVGGIATAQIADAEPPVVIHRQAESAGVAGELQTFLARVSDDYEVATVTLFYRQSALGGFQQIPMRSLLDSIGEYMIAIETSISEYPGLQYYIEAVDTAGNTASRGYSYAPIILPLERPLVTPRPTTPAPVIAQVPVKVDEPKFGTSGLLLGVGALLLLGALAGSGGSDGGSGPSNPDTVTLTIVSDGPTAN